MVNGLLQLNPRPALCLDSGIVEGKENDVMENPNVNQFLSAEQIAGLYALAGYELSRFPLSPKRVSIAEEGNQLLILLDGHENEAANVGFEAWLQAKYPSCRLSPVRRVSDGEDELGVMISGCTPQMKQRMVQSINKYCGPPSTEPARPKESPAGKLWKWLKRNAPKKD